ncbi:SMC family ATPase [Bacillus paranthracis]|uniref:AAA family ATPase n=1 Tax=Bacillus paranthracis TaxID=2026186 RepID=UPI003F6CF853
MKISEIIITNFKNYIGEHKISLDKKITILYGENGYGKSSFFDAIEWAITGTINRFEKDSGFSAQDLINDRIVNEEDPECSVVVKIENMVIKRYIKSRSVYVKLSGYYYDENKEKKVLNVAGKDNVEEILKELLFNNSYGSNLINNMMKHSFILSQDQVTDFIVRDDPNERYKSIANIMGLRRVVSYKENINQFLTQFRTQRRELNEEIEKHKHVVNLIDGKNDNIDDIKRDFLEITKDNNCLENEQIIEKIQAIIKENESLVYRHSSINTYYKELEKLDVLSYEQLHNKVNTLNLMRTKYYKHIGYVNTTLEILNSKFSKKLKQENVIREYNNLLKQKSTVENEISELEEALRSNNVFEENLALEKIDDEIMKMQKEINVLNFSLVNRKEYFLAKDFLAKVHSMEESNEKNIRNLSNKIKRKQRWFDSLSNTLANIGSNNSLSNLIEEIKEIYNYVLKVEEDKTCPVCSSEVEGSLQRNILKNIKKYSNEINLQSNRVQKLSNSITKIRKEIQDLKNSLNTVKENVKKLEEDKKFYQNFNESISSLGNFDERIINYGEEQLEDRLAIVRKKINKYIEIKKDLIDLFDLYKKRENILNQISERAREKARNLEENINIYKKKIEKRETYLKVTHNKVNILEKDLDLYKEFLKKISEEENNLGDFRDIIKQNEEVIFKIKSNVSKLKDLEQRYYQFKSNQELFSKVENAKIAIKKANHKKIKNKKLIVDLQTHIDEINSTFGEEAMEFLNKPHSVIQKYYRYMNPMTTSKHLKFLSNSKNEELQIKIYDENNYSELSAKTTLSSGQLNVLAISIFLSSNKSFDSNIDFIGIDDPIQNMDDVNRFSICDMLSNLDRQLIFSTHDLNFLKLFIKKNEHISDDIQVYNFTSPVLKEENIGRIVFD